MNEQHLPNLNGVTTVPYSIFDGLDLDNLSPYQESFRIKNVWYVLHEASKGADVAYRTSQMRNLSLVERESGERQMTGMEGSGSADVVLLSHCLFYGDQQGKLRLNNKGEPDTRYLVPTATLLSWPPKLVDPLVKRLKEVSNIDQVKTKDQIEKEIQILQKELSRLEEKAGYAEGKAQREESCQTTPQSDAHGSTTAVSG